MSKFRDELGGIPTTKTPVKPNGGTLVYLDESDTFGMSGHGQNQMARNAWAGVIDPREKTLFHGEGDVFTQLKQNGWRGEPGRTYRLFVEQTEKAYICPSCHANMQKYMRELGIERLEVFLIDGTKYTYTLESPRVRGTWK